MPKTYINMPVEASTHKYPAMFPYPLLILNAKEQEDVVIDLVKDTFKQNAAYKKQRIDQLITTLTPKQSYVVNCGEYAPDGFYYKWVEYFLKQISFPVKIMGPYATCFANHIRKIIKQTGINHEILETDYNTYNTIIPDSMLESYPKVNNKIKANMRVSLGCPRFCSMCPTGMIYQHKYTFFPIEESVAKIQYYHSHNVRVINFIDDNISVNVPKFVEFLHKLKEIPDMQYYCQEGFEVLAFQNTEFCTLLKELKFKDIKLGVENINNDFLDKINKTHLRFNDIVLAVKNIKLYKLNVKFFFLLSQFQDKKDIMENIKFFADLNVDLRVNIIRKYEGMPLPDYQEEITLAELRSLKSLAYAVAFMSIVQKFNIFQNNAWDKYCEEKKYILQPEGKELDGATVLSLLNGKQYFGFKTIKWLDALKYMLQQKYKTDYVKVNYNSQEKKVDSILVGGK